jgi:hypothetical protein
MAPNRKNVASLELPIAAEALQNVVQAKFLPLTDSREQQQHEQQQQQQQEQQKAVQDSASYWDWPADTQEEEKLDTLFSTSRIVSNLTHDGKKYEDCTGNHVAENDDYWSENSIPLADDDSEVVRSTKPQHEIDVYWSWPANRNLHLEQHAERLTSTSHKESNLKTFQEPSSFSSFPTTNKQHDDYWTWPAETKRQQPSHTDHYWTWTTLTKEEEKRQLIQSILQDENARQLCTVHHIEKKLVAASAAASKQDFLASAVPAIPSSGYWDW